MATTEAVKARTLLAECSSEFAGTFILILFGVGVVAQVVAGGIGNHDSIAWAWGIGVTMGVYVSARISGAHINPAVTIALAAFRGFAWRKVLPYIGAQFLGAFVAALVVRWNYNAVLEKFDPGLTIKSQGVFSTLPGNGNVELGVGGGAVSSTRSSAPRSSCWSSWPSSTCATPPPRRTWARSSSACWSSASEWPGARWRATRSTRRVTSGRGWPPT
jgi:Glycerol uptake facilitator and related permeases (Major Intrinsic Protein Family)